MNTLQIQRKIEELNIIISEFINKTDDISSVYKSSIDEHYNIPDNGTIDFITNNIKESKIQVESINEKLNEIHNIFSDAKINGIDLPPRLPESARHLWSVCDIAKDIFCHRKEISRSSSSQSIKIKFPEEQLLPIFESADNGKSLASSLFYEDINIMDFENQWKEKVLNPLFVILRDYQPDNMEDCMELVIEAFPEEHNRNIDALLKEQE